MWHCLLYECFVIIHISFTQKLTGAFFAHGCCIEVQSTVFVFFSKHDIRVKGSECNFSSLSIDCQALAQAQVDHLIHLTIRLKSVWNVHAGADDSAVLHISFVLLIDVMC